MVRAMRISLTDDDSLGTVAVMSDSTDDVGKALDEIAAEGGRELSDGERQIMDQVARLAESIFVRLVLRPGLSMPRTTADLLNERKDAADTADYAFVAASAFFAGKARFMTSFVQSRPAPASADSGPVDAPAAGAPPQLPQGTPPAPPGAT